MREVRRSADRFLTVGDGTVTRHSFSYGAHYDPANVRFGPLVAINVEHLAPGSGYPAHRHSDVEIITWVLEGVLRHEDSTGIAGDVGPGVLQRLSAGPGVQHTEVNASATDPLVFVQMMLASDHDGDPEIEQRAVEPSPGVLVATVRVHAPGRLHVATFRGGETLRVPPAGRHLVHVTRGDVMAGGEGLGAGDELRSDEGGPLVLSGDGPGEALVWSLDG